MINLLYSGIDLFPSATDDMHRQENETNNIFHTHLIQREDRKYNGSFKMEQVVITIYI